MFIRLLITFALLAVLPAQAARQALVIGNAAYSEGALKNPVNDARAMDGKLTALGFKVMKVENLKRQQIGRTLTAFANTLKPGDEVVVFYAEHGVQVKGINYLPAVDADIQSEEDVALNSLNLNTLMECLDEAKAGLKLLFLDACRNNPYARSLRSNDRGLARVSAAPSGTLIHFATRPVGRETEGVFLERQPTESKVDAQNGDVVAPDLASLPLAKRLRQGLDRLAGAGVDGVGENLLHPSATIGPWVLRPADLVGQAVDDEQQAVARVIAQFTAAGPCQGFQLGADAAAR